MIIISSTNRSRTSTQHRAINKDYYVTPIKPIESFLKEFEKSEDVFLHNPIILDPCAGGDNKHEMSYPKAIKDTYNDCNRLYTMDIREDSLANLKTDYLTYNTENIKPNVIITNPPFNLAIDVIEKALNDVVDNGFVIMLLRLNFFGGKLRKPFFEKQMPKYCFVHSKRISFTDTGGTDSIEYCHMVWQKGYYPEFTQLKII